MMRMNTQIGPQSFVWGGQFRNVNCVELIAKSFGKKVAVGFCFVH